MANLGGGTLPVNIGNNVFLGFNSTVLMGTEIGDNCIVGSGAIVKGMFPNGSVIAGNPATVICTTEEMWSKVSDRWVEEAKITARAIYKNKGGQLPTIEDMSDAFVWLYLPRKIECIERYKTFFDLSADEYDEIKADFLKSVPVYNSFDEFLDDCNFN